MPRGVPDKTTATPEPTAEEILSPTKPFDADEAEAKSLLKLKEAIEADDMVDRMGAGQMYLPPEIRGKMRDWHFVRIPLLAAYEQTRAVLKRWGYVLAPRGVYVVGCAHDEGVAEVYCAPPRVLRHRRDRKRQLVKKAKAAVGEKFRAELRDIANMVGDGEVRVREREVT